MNQASIELVVAHYQESLDWLSQVPVGVKATVYEKYAAAPGRVLLPNIGRNTHTYIYHIVKHYPNFADTTYFLQGNPFDRSIFKANAVAVQAVPFIEHGTDVYYEKPDDTTFHRAWRYLYDEEAPVSVSYLCCLLAVSKACLCQNPLPFYEKVLATFETGCPGGVEARSMTYIMERMWWRMFKSNPPLAYNPCKAGRTERVR